MLPEADVAVRIDEPGQDPAVRSVSTEDGLGVLHRFGTEHAVDDPPLDRLFIGQPATAYVQWWLRHA
ncbi:hypothetical protein MGALJ_06200 [Mycobacterium gallinarum]|uniref:Uncharacterized protein n=1 Tax=Mycobacterium gallinarum TaxID=39689 RepID=A0A9W4AYS1_9MYCO|nr:hypothetical protein MGALJ_06200 [Mycobacterium gallinarum]